MPKTSTDLDDRSPSSVPIIAVGAKAGRISSPPQSILFRGIS